MKKRYFVLMLSLCSNMANAGPASELAETHFRAIAAGKVNDVVMQYHDNASLHWLGGPLDGHYAGKQALGTVWGKFTNALGPMEVKFENMAENSNPKGTTITADVFFKGKKMIPVRYILSYRGDKLVNEIWQISPGLAK